MLSFWPQPLSKVKFDLWEETSDLAEGKGDLLIKNASARVLGEIAKGEGEGIKSQIYLEPES